MNPACGPEISCRIVAVDFEELISKSLSHSGFFPHRDVLENVSRVETQYTARRTRPHITRGRSYQLSHVNGVSSPSHLSLHLSSPCHTLKEGQGKVALGRWEIILLAIQFENSLPLSG